MSAHKRKSYKKARYKKAYQRFYARSIAKFKPYQSELTQMMWEYKAKETESYISYLKPCPIPN